MSDNHGMARGWRIWGILLCLGVAGAQAVVRKSPDAAGSTAHKTLTPAGTLRPLKPHPVVTLTFDDLPAAGDLLPGTTRAGTIEKLAAELKANHLEGTYGFVTATDLEDDPDTQQALREWVDAGMNIGNHTWSHPSLTSDSAEAFEKDIALDEPALRQYDPKRDWHWFRYPYLEEGDTLDKRDAVRAWLHEHGYRIAEVTLNFEDDDWDDAYGRCLEKHDEANLAWLRQSYLDNAAEFIRLGREEEQIAFGHEIPNVLLLHATTATTDMLPSLLAQLRQEGFRFTSLPRVERNPAYAQDVDAASADGGPLPNQFLNARHLQYPPFTPEPSQKLQSVCR
ncbi:MAG TPA: polysaccharide deacetylase family protein [Acidobacteriaceae bacterium]|nr:polysaccharide deacetylase family protein [Acidobacteriaceae bacterium]